VSIFKIVHFKETVLNTDNVVEAKHFFYLSYTLLLYDKEQYQMLKCVWYYKKKIVTKEIIILHPHTLQL